MVEGPKPGPRLYAVLLSAQTATAIVLFWLVFPVFHNVVNHLGERIELELSNQIAIVASAAALHCLYWARLKLVSVTPPFQDEFVAHIVLFASRVSFFFGGALFSVLFFRRLPELDVLPSFGQSVVKGFYVALTLFALFCYSLELDRLGKAMEERSP